MFLEVVGSAGLDQAGTHCGGWWHEKTVVVPPTVESSKLPAKPKVPVDPSLLYFVSKSHKVAGSPAVGGRRPPAAGSPNGSRRKTR